jgi:hypothetical protein
MAPGELEDLPELAPSRSSNPKIGAQVGVRQHPAEHSGAGWL